MFEIVLLYIENILPNVNKVSINLEESCYRVPSYAFTHICQCSLGSSYWMGRTTVYYRPIQSSTAQYSLIPPSPGYTSLGYILQTSLAH